jgi:diacylglycerol kinase family enzyme
MTEPRSAAIFVNEGAGSARSGRVRRTIELVRAALDADLHVTATRSPSELAGWLAERVTPYTTVVIAGGDGSLGIAYNVLEGRDVAIGYIPAGFGNATAHLLRLPRRPEALAAVVSGATTRAVDLVRIDGRLALFAGAGWDAVVAGRYASAGAHRLRGWATAVVGSMSELIRRHVVRVEAEGRTLHEGPMELLVASTTPYYGRGLRVNPGARPDSGRITLRVYPGPIPLLAAEAVRWAVGATPSARPAHVTSAIVTALDGRPLPVQADGDLIGERDVWRLEVAPAAARLIGRW